MAIILAGDRLAAMAKDIAGKPPGPRPPEFAPTLRRLQMSSVVGMVTLFAVL